MTFDLLIDILGWAVLLGLPLLLMWCIWLSRNILFGWVVFGFGAFIIWYIWFRAWVYDRLDPIDDPLDPEAEETIEDRYRRSAE